MKKLFTTLLLSAGILTANAAIDFSNYTSDPAQGIVDEISKITVNFPDIYEIEFLSSEGIYLIDPEFEEVAGSVKMGFELNQFFYVPAEPVTAPGTYTLCIGAETLTGYNEDYSDYADNPAEIYLQFTIEGEADPFAGFSAVPATGTSMTELPEATLTFDSFAEVTLADASLVAVSLNQQQLEAINYSLSATGNTVTVNFSPALKSQGEDMAVDITFAPGALKGDAQANTQPIEVKYLLAASVSYDIALALSTPTKPNADGEISAEKQLTSFFFVADEAGLVAASGSADNVTVREINGTFEVSGHLRKAFGLDATKTYFSVEFSSEPRYNGEYEVVISEGAIGNEAWSVNPATGRSNPQLTMTFTLVDGVDRVTYNLEPASISPEESSVADAAVLSLFTIRFDEDVELAAEAHATLAATDNDYAATSDIVAVSAREFTVSFDPAPTADGSYILNIPKGTFKNAAGNLNAELTRAYQVDATSGVSLLPTGSEDAPAAIFTLQGTRMPTTSPATLPAGLYIINGRKVAVR